MAGGSAAAAEIVAAGSARSDHEKAGDLVGASPGHGHPGTAVSVAGHHRPAGRVECVAALEANLGPSGPQADCP